jgi:hypothetical protein
MVWRLFDDAVLATEKWNQTILEGNCVNGLGKNRSWPIMTYYSSGRLKYLRETAKGIILTTSVDIPTGTVTTLVNLPDLFSFVQTSAWDPDSPRITELLEFSITSGHNVSETGSVWALR